MSTLIEIVYQVHFLLSSQFVELIKKTHLK